MSKITLPRSAVKEINDEYVMIELPNHRHEIVNSQLSEIKKAWGSISKEKADEWLKELEQMRAEWDRL
jgi:hypothetical protein